MGLFSTEWSVQSRHISNVEVTLLLRTVNWGERQSAGKQPAERVPSAHLQATSQLRPLVYTTTLTLLKFTTKTLTHFSLVFSFLGKNGSDEVVTFDIWNQRMSEWYDALLPQMLVYMFNSRPLHVLIFCYLLLYKDKATLIKGHSLATF